MPIERTRSFSFSTVDRLETVLSTLDKVIIGKREVTEKILICILSGGHVLLEDVPGVGKTMLVSALSAVLDLQFKRIQCTPDLMPSDLTGYHIYDQASGQFQFREGPIVTQLLLADELNRTSPKTQSALLEAMEEKKLTVEGKKIVLPKPFIVIATQNPLDFEGTYALPEAQLDRFMMKLQIGYPEAEAEEQMLIRSLEHPHGQERLKPLLFQEELQELNKCCCNVYLDRTLFQYIVQIVNRTREDREILLGASPRASLQILRAAQARAFIYKRSFVLPDDIKAVVPDVLAHRIVWKQGDVPNHSEAMQLVMKVVEQIPVPALKYKGSGKGAVG